MSDEKTVWKGTSSPILNIRIYALCAGISLAWIVICFYFMIRFGEGKRMLYFIIGVIGWLIPLVYASIKHFLLRARTYEVTTERVRITNGLFSKRTEEVELYRVMDYTVVEPFWQRIFRVGSIELATHDETMPKVMIQAVPNVIFLRDELRKNVEICRERKKVRLAELE